ncbi:MAG: class I SAM-dependent rRNA methyltransferase [Rikenellaceae bacterium]
MAKIYLKKGKEESLKRFHPWVFSGAIASADGEIEEGQIVEIYSVDKKFIAKGHCSLGSIAVRVLTFDNETIDGSWWEMRLGSALSKRRAMGLIDNPETTCYRLVHGEGDLLPGLIVDVYNDIAVVQSHSLGMHEDRNIIAEALQTVMKDYVSAIYYKSAGTLPDSVEETEREGYLFDNREDKTPTSTVVLEHNNKFIVDWVEGQKTGFFIDQRENRQLVETYSKGRNVLNTFCYTGGFSVYALAGGAKTVESVDCSAKAVARAEENAEINNYAETHKGVTIDAFDYLKNLKEDFYDLIILDPPAFAKRHKATPNALQGYKRINAQAMTKIKKGGILFTFSCSQAVSKEQFRTTVFSAAAIAGRKVSILHQVTQPSDHPVNIYHPEGEYLKGLVLYVE